ncbi:MAG: AraC family transcriptional regulator [Pedosphaera sp.]|nr:AraC family transcriptional regulator [Pedosphaera sp.]
MSAHSSAEYPHHESSPIEPPQGAKPFGRRLVRGVGVSVRVEWLLANVWPKHRYPMHWQVVFVFAPGICHVTWREPRGKLVRRRIVAGQVWILPPGWRHTVRWCANAQVIALYVETTSVQKYFPKLVAEAAVTSLCQCVALQPEIAGFCAELRRLGAVESPAAHWHIAGIGTQLAAAIMGAQTRLNTRGASIPVGLADRIVEKVKVHLAGNIKEKVPHGELARALGVSGRHFRRLFQRATGKSLQEFARFARTKNAKKLLQSGGYTVKQAADAAGFSDNSYLNRCTQAYYGVSPSALIPQRAWPIRA